MDNYNWKKALPKASNNFHNNVCSVLTNLPEKEERKVMNKKIFFGKGLGIAIAAILLIGVTAFASTGIISSYFSSSSNIPTYTALPTNEQVKKDFGFDTKLIEKFSNGYTFDNGYTVNSKVNDENGNAVETYKELDCTYTRNNIDLCLDINNSLVEFQDENGLFETYKGIKIYYSHYLNKCVSGNYQMTQQDKEDEANGKYVFSYGVEKDEAVNVQSIRWSQNGINYAFSAINSDLIQQELAQMAKEIIDMK